MRLSFELLVTDNTVMKKLMSDILSRDGVDILSMHQHPDEQRRSGDGEDKAHPGRDAS